jgi:hypothetical protein
MIATLPIPYPDELFYSLCARYCDRMHYPSKRSATRELFGTGNVIASVGLPSHIDDFVAALPQEHRFTADNLIDSHTLLPFYAPFLLPERLHRLRQDMHGRNGPAIFMRIGLMAGRVSPPEWLRLCPLCVEEDQKEFGESYWHRVHQISGVEVCPIHQVYLYHSSVRARNVQTRYEFVSAECSIRPLHLPSPTEPPHTNLLNIARDARWLLDQQGLSQSPQALNAGYCERLAALGLATYRGRVDKGALSARFTDYYSSSFLRLLQCELDEHINDNWLLRLVRTPRNAQHPLHHLLLIYFLGLTAETFFGLSAERKPFGEGPWSCLNPACNEYRQDKIDDCQIIYSQHIGGRPIGTFACACGFTYRRVGPDVSTGDSFKLSNVASFGYLWEARLQLLWEDETVSLRGMARQLGVDPLTIKRHANRIGLAFPRPVRTSRSLKATQQLHAHNSTHGTPEPSTIDKYRASWAAAMRDNPDAGTQALRGKIPGIYTWLYRNDRAWLKEYTPPSKRKPRQRPARVNWEERDAQLAKCVRESAIRLRKKDGKPVRITSAAIGRDIGQLALIQQHLDKLPLTAAALDELVESREQFAVKRIRHVGETLPNGLTCLARWQLIRQAGVERLVADQQVKETIDATLEYLKPTSRLS